MKKAVTTVFHALFFFPLSSLLIPGGRRDRFLKPALPPPDFKPDSPSGWRRQG